MGILALILLIVTLAMGAQALLKVGIVPSLSRGQAGAIMIVAGVAFAGAGGYLGVDWSNLTGVSDEVEEPVETLDIWDIEVKNEDAVHYTKSDKEFNIRYRLNTADNTIQLYNYSNSTYENDNEAEFSFDVSCIYDQKDVDYFWLKIDATNPTLDGTDLMKNITSNGDDVETQTKVEPGQSVLENLVLEYDTEAMREVDVFESTELSISVSAEDGKDLHTYSVELTRGENVDTSA